LWQIKREEALNLLIEGHRRSEVVRMLMDKYNIKEVTAKNIIN